MMLDWHHQMMISDQYYQIDNNSRSDRSNKYKNNSRPNCRSSNKNNNSRSDQSNNNNYKDNSRSNCGLQYNVNLQELLIFKGNWILKNHHLIPVPPTHGKKFLIQIKSILHQWCWQCKKQKYHKEELPHLSFTTISFWYVYPQDVTTFANKPLFNFSSSTSADKSLFSFPALVYRRQSESPPPFLPCSSPLRSNDLEGSVSHSIQRQVVEVEQKFDICMVDIEDISQVTDPIPFDPIPFPPSLLDGDRVLYWRIWSNWMICLLNNMLTPLYVWINSQVL